ncbi:OLIGOPEPTIDE TRANSPORTER-RELATED [Salix koriyanagi]|uniref:OLIGOPEPTIDE TRANSPORTER-RELATED n=1 Tax=Salix koriyanagi TaxID=2511006 RepID=A0A9Q0W0L1_9ROSI|nr:OLIGOPEPTIDE TRANSPORTER-RELATED [Salix koriyanagi]
MITEPLLSNPKGGITALLFIIANEALERLASFGLSTNMIMYLTREYGMDAASGAQILFLYSAAGNFMPIIGAFLADTYVGRYPMIGFGCITSLLGSAVVVPSERIRFLNRACVITNPEEDLMPDGRASDPWCLCTVDQVEELKALIKVIPIWSTGMLVSVNVCQNSFLLLQASTMNRHITSKFEIPAGSFYAFLLLSSTIWIALYDRVIIPLASKIRGKPTRLGLKQKIGLGILVSAASMAVLAIIERVRRETAIREGISDNPDAAMHMSAMWLLPFYFLLGFSEAMNGVGQNEFFYTELPKSMSSVASNLFSIGLSAASLVASFIVSVVRGFISGENQESWVSSNINKGHYDYYYWLLATLGFATFIYYLACSKAYGPCKGGQGGIAGDVREGSADDDDDVDDDYSSLS